MKCLLVAGAVLALIAGPAMAQTEPQIRINAGEEPEQKPWSQPASVSYSSNEGAKDSIAVDFAGRIDIQPSEKSTGTAFVRGVAQVNTQQKKEVQNFEGQVGYAFDFDTADHNSQSDTINVKAWYFFGDAKVGIQDKTIFPDPKAVCTGTPSPAECGRQSETSLRGTIQLQPFFSLWESTMFQDPETKKWDGVAYSFSPVVGLFYDKILSAKINASGIQPKGVVAGSKIEINGAFAPRFLDFRVVLRGKVQWTQVFQRDDRRSENFGRSSMLYKASVDYELGRRSFEPEGSKWIPAIGVSYVKGDDPLVGKNDQGAFSVGFKLTYRAK